MLNTMQTQANLKQAIKIKFHTNYAINLIDGSNRKKHKIAGLLIFASKFKIVERDSNLQNPYAKYYIKITKKNYAAAEVEIKNTSKYCADIIMKSKKNGVEILVAENNNPIEKSFTFTAPLCYKVALLLSDYDLCIREVQSIYNLGLISDSDYQDKINSMGQCLRSLFHSVESYVSTSVTIEDIQIGNIKALEAKSKMSNVNLFN
ncbi:AcaB family transcriptional regulator [Psychromonas sp. B3M02]|uniref:AcaB family transcriptional regulator n=1 Tax=Psychromonas sp. B3M02 TaxID=2267226 RepID=UPI0015F02B25|nr:AcaB family transcriptional regulator [Psychromonas sp. B3M02]